MWSGLEKQGWGFWAALEYSSCLLMKPSFSMKFSLPILFSISCFSFSLKEKYVISTAHQASLCQWKKKKKKWNTTLFTSSPNGTFVGQKIICNNFFFPCQTKTFLGTGKLIVLSLPLSVVHRWKDTWQRKIFSKGLGLRALTVFLGKNGSDALHHLRAVIRTTSNSGRLYQWLFPAD